MVTNALNESRLRVPLVVAAGWRGLRSDGAQSPEVVLPILQKLLCKQGADELNVHTLVYIKADWP